MCMLSYSPSLQGNKTGTPSIPFSARKKSRQPIQNLKDRGRGVCLTIPFIFPAR